VVPGDPDRPGPYPAAGPVPVEHLLAGLDRTQRALSVLNDLVGQMGTVAPQRVTGTDPAGAVEVVLGRDGLPETIGVRPDWRRTVGAAGFAEAVTAACRSAATGRAAGWQDGLERGDFAARLDRALADLATPGDPGRPDRDGAGAVPPGEAAAPGGRAGPGTGGPALERAVGALAAAAGVPDAATATGGGTGHAAVGRLELTVTEVGTVTCRADPDWVGRQDADQLTEALAAALAGARAGLAGPAGPPDRPGPRRPELDTLFDAVRALLRHPDDGRGGAGTP